jgi:hypothetical protein
METHISMGSSDLVSLFLFILEVETDPHLRLLDFVGISRLEDGRRLPVDVDLDLLDFVGLRSRLSCAGRLHCSGRMARSMDVFEKITSHPPISYPCLSNACARIVHPSRYIVRFTNIAHSHSIIYIITTGFFDFLLSD